MATITDVLETVLRTRGADTVKSDLGSVAGQLDANAQRSAALGRINNELGRAFDSMGGAAGVAGAILAAVTAIAGKALSTFAEDEQAIFRTTVVLRNLGNSYPIEKAQEFASKLADIAGIDDEAIVSIIGLEKRFGIADDQIEATTKTIVDFSAATGTDLSHAAELVGRATLGQTRGLKLMGIQMEDTGDKAKNLAILQQKLDSIFGGAGAARKGTLGGAIQDLNERLADLFSAIGSQLATVIVPMINAISDFVKFLTAHSSVITSILGGLAGASAGFYLGGPVGALIGGIAGLGAGLIPSKGNAAEQVGKGGGRLATEDTLKKIEGNTQATADALIQKVLGGPGTVAKGAATARDFRMAFAI